MNEDLKCVESCDLDLPKDELVQELLSRLTSYQSRIGCYHEISGKEHDDWDDSGCARTDFSYMCWKLKRLLAKE